MFTPPGAAAGGPGLPPPPPGAPPLLLSGAGVPVAKSAAERKVEEILASCANTQDIIAAVEAEIEKALIEALVSEERLKTTPDFLSILVGCEHLYEPGVIKGYGQLDAETRVAASSARAAAMEVQVLALQEETRRIDTALHSSSTYKRLYSQIQGRISELEQQVAKSRINPDPSVVQTNDVYRAIVAEYHKLLKERSRMDALKSGDALPFALKLAICQHNATLSRTQKRLDALQKATVQSFSSHDVIMRTRQESSKLSLRKDVRIYYEALVEQQFIDMLAGGKAPAEITAELSKAQRLYQESLKAKMPDRTQDLKRLSEDVVGFDTGIQGKIAAIARQKQFNDSVGITGTPKGDVPLRKKMEEICRMLGSIETCIDDTIGLDFQMQIADCQSIAAASHAQAILKIANTRGAFRGRTVGAPGSNKPKTTVTDRSSNAESVVYKFSKSLYTDREKVMLAERFDIECDIETLDSDLDTLFRPFAKSPSSPDSAALAGIAKRLSSIKGVLQDELYAPCELIESILGISDISGELMRRKAEMDKQKAAIMRSAPISGSDSGGSGSDVDSEMDVENNSELLRLGASTLDLEERSRRQEQALSAMQAELSRAQQTLEEERKARAEVEKKNAEIEAIVRTGSPPALLVATLGAAGAKQTLQNVAKGRRK